MERVTKIALTGGPCGGKSTGISIMEQKLTDKGYKVFIVEEMATNVINSGAAPWVITNEAFQNMLIKLQNSRNNVYSEMAEQYAKEHNTDVIIIYDRGIPDGLGFMDRELYHKLLDTNGLNETVAQDYYDGVFHLVTAADGAIEAYTCENNTARTETPEEAIERDKSCLKAWTGHSHLRVISNGCTFEEKLHNLMKEVYTLLGVPVPVETERKYLIEMPDMDKLKETYECTTVNIIQTYLKRNSDDVERRVRQRGVNGNYSYYYTEKRILTGVSREEKEKKITEQEYLRLLMEADTKLHQIRKNRTCFVCENKYFELDVYPFCDDKAILEIELTSESQSVTLPKELKLIKEVTEDKDYKNESLAKSNGNI